MHAHNIIPSISTKTPSAKHTKKNTVREKIENLRTGKKMLYPAHMWTAYSIYRGTHAS